MKTLKILALSISIASLFACEQQKSHHKKSVQNAVVPKLSKADSILNLTMKAHGGELYNHAHYSFVFRGNRYEFQNQNSTYTYSKTSSNKNSITKDILENGKFSRYTNNKIITLKEEKSNSALNSLNSVIYFATLPHKLGDASVIKKHIGSTTIQEQEYELLKITFLKEGGGEDYDDQFVYWINKKNHLIDYLAYSYKTNNGGIRFRAAYNRRNVSGIIFQDYVNFKALIGTNLEHLGQLYESNQLEEISRIQTEQVRKLN